MKEAFKRHLPIWILMVLAFAVALTLVLVARKDDVQPDSQEQTRSPADANQLDSIELIYETDGFSAPVDIASTGISADTRLYIVEQAGKVRILDQTSKSIAKTPMLDLGGKIQSGGEMGLLGLVFDNDLAKRPYIYVNYTRETAGGQETLIARYLINDDQTKADPASEKIILRQAQPFTNHNAGDLAFGPDGYLYVPLGDGGSRGDPSANAQNKKSLLGKILRLDVHTDKAYEVPGDNPFVNDSAYRSEIWSMGLRNPWRISFDSQTGDMWIGDVGQNAFEEINHEPRGQGGRNYGWRCWEGAKTYNDEGCLDKSNYTFPVTQYQHEGDSCGGSVTGGFVYRGSQTAMSGHYFYADYCKGRIYALNAAGPTYTALMLRDTDFGITTFGVDNSGEIHLADAKTGTIYQLNAP